MLVFPDDIPSTTWDSTNLSLWRDSSVAVVDGRLLLPLEAKALHVLGTVVQILNAAGHLLYSGKKNRPCADYCLYAYMSACTAIELLGRCQTGATSLTQSRLKEGLRLVGLDTVTVNVPGNGSWTSYIYDVDKLTALRNLVAHGQAIASSGGGRVDVILHVELLDTFPLKLINALDAYFEALYSPSDPVMRKHLATAAVDPVLYAANMGQIPYLSPIKEADILVRQGKRPSEGLKNTDWQLYNPDRDALLSI